MVMKTAQVIEVQVINVAKTQSVCVPASSLNTGRAFAGVVSLLEGIGGLRVDVYEGCFASRQDRSTLICKLEAIGLCYYSLKCLPHCNSFLLVLLGPDPSWLLVVSKLLINKQCCDWAFLASLSFLCFTCFMKASSVGTGVSFSCGFLGPQPT